MRLKGFDQVTAWFSGIMMSALVFTLIWYGSKYIASLDSEKDQARVETALKEIQEDEAKQSENDSADSKTGGKSSLEHPSGTSFGKKSGQTEAFAKFGYSGNLAPWYWASLNEKWHQCGLKSGQSPIDISGAKLDDRLKTLKFHYTHGVTRVTLGHQTIQGNVERGSYLEWDGERFDLNRVYFRTPSEHRVNGLPYEMEVQLEHSAVTGKTIMLSVLLTPGKTSELIENMAQHMPSMDEEIQEIERLNWQNLLPAQKTYWSYTGSMTTPPCTGNVLWVLMTNTVTTSKASIDKFVLKQKSNVRPVFSIGKRELSRSNR
jgi:carbonic anhydrase